MVSKTSSTRWPATGHPIGDTAQPVRTTVNAIPARVPNALAAFTFTVPSWPLAAQRLGRVSVSRTGSDTRRVTVVSLRVLAWLRILAERIVGGRV